MNRKQFIQLTSGLALLGTAWQGCTSRNMIRSRIVGANAAAGHLLRDGKTGTPTTFLKKQLVIAGGGVSGLSAAWYLQKQGFTDFLLLDLEAHTGGNAAHGVNDISAYPWGAHYVPIPNNDLTEYIDFLQSAGVVVQRNSEGLPAYNEEHLCFDPQERLFINGRWQEGLIPQFGVPTPERKQIERFLLQMNEYRYAKGSDGKDAFAIPINASSTDETYVRLDKMTMQQWLKENEYTSHYLHGYVNYCCRDDFGTAYDTISAWAGIHYFAARKGKGTNAEHGDVLTWPEGNGFLVNALQQSIPSYCHTSSLVTGVDATAEGVRVDVADLKTGNYYAVDARECILAVPQLVAARLLKQEERKALVKQHFHYAPWMVANITTKGPLKEREGAAVSWDNVIFDGPSLGYVEATHQLLQQQATRKNLTYYYPLTGGSPADERKKAQQRSADEWTNLIINDLERIHPSFRESIAEVNIMLWGHAMAQPLPGFITGSVRQEMARSLEGKIHFAHSDLAGVSIFEEAFYQGLNAAKRVLKQIPA
ncbi:MAG: FAD-dependent oxidoreductase [Bacteroidetes bacterium]|nr:FAD-dependent oxidoreductase [Bacteroidota bacterium]